MKNNVLNLTKEYLIDEIVLTCKDYRYDDGFDFNKNHVIKWISQFEESTRIPILTEMNHILKNSYVSKEFMLSFFESVIDYINEKHPDQNIVFLDCQKKGHSQSELKLLFEKYIENNNIKIGNSSGKNLWLYLDDFIFTGNTAVRDLAQLEISYSDILIISIAVHSKSEYYIKTKTKVPILRMYTLENINHDNAQSVDVIWPSSFKSTILDDYIDNIEDLHKNDLYPSKYALFCDNNPNVENLFSNDTSRRVFEKEFILAGIDLINKSKHPNKSMKPLGYDYKKTLGFGSTLVSFRNCPNNCPLVMWYGTTNGKYGPTSTLNSWYPLFPRKTNDKKL